MASKRPPTAEEEAARQKKEERDRARAERHAKRRVGRPTPEEDKDKEEKPIVGEMTEEVALEEELGDEGILVQGAEGPQDVVGVAREIAALLSIAQLRNREGETERKVRFRAVGREEGSYWDDVYMVTSIHHHVSISQLKVSKPYLRFLRTGKYPKADHEFIKQGGWDKLELKKTKYLSLMVPEERVQAARALVTVLRWETRLEKELAR